MKSSRWIGVFFIVLVGVLLSRSTAFANETEWQKGASIYPVSNSDFGSITFKQSLYGLSQLGANYVTLIVPYYQESYYSTEIKPGWNTPSDESLVDAISYAHSLGLNVMLKPHLEVDEGGWRADIRPTDRQAWFKSYNTLLQKYARIARQNKVEQLCIGTELISMSSRSAHSANTKMWRSMIAEVRANYNGSLTYSANWGGSKRTDEKSQIEFWDDLDYLGISAYYPLVKSTAGLKGWEDWERRDIGPFQRKFNKPLLFTEVGYRSLNNSHKDPWDYARNGGVNEELQAQSYDYMLSFWSKIPYISGVHIWNWESSPALTQSPNTYYTIQNEKAESVVRGWFKSIQPDIADEPTSPPPLFSTSSNTTRSSISVGKKAGVGVLVKNSGGAINDILVDIEVYNSAGEKVFQQYYKNQNFRENQSRTYSLSWAPKEVDSYTIKIGAFSYDWKIAYFWQEDSTQFTSTPSVGLFERLLSLSPFNFFVGKAIADTQ